MSWHLAPEVGMAVVGEDLVFLDVPQDAYICLPSGAAAIRRASFGLLIDDEAVCQDLADAGLIEHRAGVPRGQTPAPTPTSDLRGQARVHPRLGEQCAFGALTVLRSGDYHRRSLQQMLAIVRHRGDGPRRYSALAPDPELIRRAAVFERLLPWAPRQEACLYRSFMLLRFLGDFGRDANWVFGVRTRPFEAHCWVQAGGVVLNDSMDHARTYAPILVI